MEKLEEIERCEQVRGRERERDRDRDRQTDRQTKSGVEGESEKMLDRSRGEERERDSQTDRQTKGEEIERDGMKDGQSIFTSGCPSVGKKEENL